MTTPTRFTLRSDHLNDHLAGPGEDDALDDIEDLEDDEDWEEDEDWDEDEDDEEVEWDEEDLEELEK